MTNKNICAYLWTHVAIDSDLSVMPCCRFLEDADFESEDFRDIHNLAKQPLSKLWDSNHYNKIRKDMLADKQIKGCEKCIVSETASSFSLRNEANNLYGKFIGTKKIVDMPRAIVRVLYL